MNRPGADPPGETFSTREVQILQLLAEGLTNKQIAQKLFLSPGTVKWYNKQIYSKLHVNNRTQAGAKAREIGLLDEAAEEAEAIAIPPQHNLPSPLTSFVGRESEKADVTSLLQRSRLVTLTGPGGSGKTRLALEVAREVVRKYADGVIFVGLASTPDPALVSDALAHVLGVVEHPNRSLARQLQRALSNKQLLLLVDNFEHVLAAAPLIAELLSAAPRLTVMTTSREPLHLSGEHEYLVPPLHVPLSALPGSLSAVATNESVSLFVQRAQAVSQGFRLTVENAPDVAAICRRLDGLPLALELAAARIKLFSPEQMLQRLDSRLSLLTAGAQDLPARQRTLRNTIDWSYDLLDEVERQLFARLAVFRGGRSLAAIAAICGPGLARDPLAALESLLNRSLIYQETSPDREPRFLMLETLHEYARERLKGSGEEEEIRNRHLRYFLGFAEEAEQHLRGPDQLTWLQQLDSEYENMRAALAWSQEDAGSATLGLRLAGSLGLFWDIRSHFSEGRDHLAAALARSEGSATGAARAKALLEAGRLAYEQGDYPVARAQLKESLSIYRLLEPADPFGLAHALRMLGDLEIAVGNYTTASSLLQEALRMMQERDDTAGSAIALWQLGWCAMRPGDYEQARHYFAQALAIYRQLGDKANLAMVLSGLGELAVRQHDYERATALLEESVALHREVDSKWGIAASLGTLAWSAMRQNNLEQAAVLLAESLTLRRDMEDVGGIAWCLEKLAEIALSKGQEESSSRQHEALLRAARLFAAAAALRAPLDSVIDLADRPDYERQLALVRAQLDKTTFTAAWAEGQAMDMEQAVTYAFVQGRGSQPDGP